MDGRTRVDVAAGFSPTDACRDVIDGRAERVEARLVDGEWRVKTTIPPDRPAVPKDDGPC
jgi:hypothetical protein